VTIRSIYLPLSVDYHDDYRELCQFGLTGIAARDLAVSMACYCRRHLSDGWVPAAQLPILCYPLPSEDIAVLLQHLETTLVIDVKPNGFYLRDYTAKYGTKADAEKRSEIRRAAGKLGGRPSGKRAGSSGGKASGFATETKPETMSHAGAREDKDRDKDNVPPPYPPPDSAPSAYNGGGGGGDLITQARALMAVQGVGVSDEQAAEIVRAIIMGRTDIAHPAAYLASRISNTEQARALAPRTAAPAGPPTPKAHPRTDRLIADAFEDRLGAVISSGQAALVREDFAGQGITDPAEMISLIESAPDPRALLPARRHVPGRTVAAALGVGGVRIPATEEQRHKHADDARAGLESRRAELQQHTEPEQLAEQLAEPEPPF
jgi:hypothetical protein